MYAISYLYQLPNIPDRVALVNNNSDDRNFSEWQKKSWHDYNNYYKPIPTKHT